MNDNHICRVIGQGRKPKGTVAACSICGQPAEQQLAPAGGAWKHQAKPEPDDHVIDPEDPDNTDHLSDEEYWCGSRYWDGDWYECTKRAGHAVDGSDHENGFVVWIEEDAEKP